MEDDLELTVRVLGKKSVCRECQGQRLIHRIFIFILLYILYQSSLMVNINNIFSCVFVLGDMGVQTDAVV